jgi:signal transduction histidine kinase
LLVGDPDQVIQVVINIVLNGIQATPPGGRVDVDVQEVQEDGRVYCRIEVRDTGRGIPDEMRDAIFNPFFTTKNKGTGLGLAIAHQIVSENGGFIGVDSVEGIGTTFFIYLPAAVAKEASGRESYQGAIAGTRGAG